MISFSFLFIVTFVAVKSQANPDYFNLMENDSLALGIAQGCDFCSLEPPPDDIIYIPPPPLHPNYPASSVNRQAPEHCSFCNIFYNDAITKEGGSDHNYANFMLSFNNLALLVAFLSISGVLYLLGTRRSKIIASLTRTGPSNNGHHQADKSSSLNERCVHLSDPCLTSPIISDHVPHKKTSIPSKYWAQPSSIIGRTVRRIPNEYEVPSSRTNSTGTSSAIYADMNNEFHQRFLSPYNLHTYAEVREGVYEQPPQRAQVVITSNNQGVSPTLLNYKEQFHNVI